MSGKLTLSPGRGGLHLPLEAITQTFGILAVRGAGKTNLAAVMAEEMYDQRLPFVVVDPVGSWWGLRADGEGAGLAIPIFGGRHGDVPLEETGGQLLADLVVEERLSCVLDVHELSESAKIRFLIAFAERLYRKNQDPLHLFLEEADDYAPQKPYRDQAHLLRAWQNIVRRGRARGLGITMITQRSAVLNKDVLTQIETLFVLRTTSPQDRKAIGAWVEHHGQAKNILESLPTLADGEAWVWSPHWLDRMDRVRIRRRRTFDSGATPKDVRGRRPPATLADVDLGAIRSKMVQTIERAKQDDPKALRKEITLRDRRIRELERAKPAHVEPQVIEVPVLTGEQLSQLKGSVDRMGDVADQLVTVGGEIRGGVGAIVEALHTIQNGKPAAPPATRARRSPAVARLRSGSQRAERPSSLPNSATVSSGEDLSTAQQAVLNAAAFLESVGIEDPDVVQLALFAGQSARGGYWRANVGRCRTLGLMHGTRLTDAGRRRAQLATITTVEELHEHIFTNLLKGPQRKILQVLIDAYPEALDREEVGRRAQLEPSGGYWRANVGRLRSLKLITKDGPMAALPVLFLGR